MSEMRVWSNGEEAYIAQNIEAVIEYHRTEYGMHNDDIPPADEWHEQTGNISITFDDDVIDERLRAGAIRIVPGKHQGQMRITKLASDWCKGVTNVEMLWSTNY